MHSNCWGDVAAVFDALDTAMNRVLALPLDAISTAERFAGAIPNNPSRW